MGSSTRIEFLRLPRNRKTVYGSLSRPLTLRDAVFREFAICLANSPFRAIAERLKRKELAHAGQANLPRRKKPYVKPELKVHGSVAELTQHGKPPGR